MLGSRGGPAFDRQAWYGTEFPRCAFRRTSVTARPWTASKTRFGSPQHRGHAGGVRIRASAATSARVATLQIRTKLGLGTRVFGRRRYVNDCRRERLPNPGAYRRESTGIVAATQKIDARRSPAPTRAARAREALVLKHTGLVRRIAYHVVRRLPRHVEVDDLIQAGMIGLIEATQRFAPGKAASFETYAAIRIRGAILDSFRKSDWSPRSLHRRVREIAEAKCRIENETGEDLRRAVAAAIDALPEKERVILLLYYDEELLLREIGDRLELSESRVCQIHHRAVERLRVVAERWMRTGGVPNELAVACSA
jgi:RNA polymerase sigma factor for flagellar operon FliA